MTRKPHPWKPHLYQGGVLWRCVGNGVTGFGASIDMAYAQWAIKAPWTEEERLMWRNRGFTQLLPDIRPVDTLVTRHRRKLLAPRTARR